METKNREKLLAIVAGAALFLLFLNWIVISPMIDSWHARSKQIADLKKSITEGAMLIRRQDSIRASWQEMQTNALEKNPAIAESQLLSAFDRWVSQSGVTEGSFRPQLHDNEDNYSTIDCRADVSGNMTQIAQFLYALEKDSIGVRIDSLELASKDDNGQQMTLGLEISGLISPPPTSASTTP